ncbi:hypothetical protein Tco_0498910 [Tanacetum coccineum]
MDDALVPREQLLQIGSCNYRLSTTFKPKEPTFQVALDVLSLTPFYPAFLISASVPAIYMHEFWATASYHKHSIRFKLNTKSYYFDLDTFRNMLQMCPKLPGQKFVDHLFEEEILTFMRELDYSGNIKLLSNVKVDILPQPWRTLGTIINKCLSGKVTGIDTLRLSRAQILWGLYHQKKVDFHEVVQKYGAILPDNLTTQEKTEQAHEASSGKRLKATAQVTRSSKKKQPAKGLETLSEIALSEAEQMKLAIERSKTQLHSSQPNGSGAHEGTGVSPGVPDVPKYGSDEEQISWKSSDKEYDDDEANIGKDEDDDQDDDDNADHDDDDERTKSDNDGDDFVHPKLSTHDEEDKHDKEDKEEDRFDPKVQTPSHVESIDDEDSDEEIQGANVEGDEEETNEEDEGHDLYRDVNVNLEGRDIEMTDAQQTNVQPTQVTEDTHVIITTPVNPEGQQQSSSVSSGFISNMLNPSPDTLIDSIFNLNTESTSLVDVLVNPIAEPPLLSITTTPPPPTPLNTHLQQTPAPIPETVPRSSLQDLPNFGSLFKFDHRLKTLENDFSEFKKMNQFAAAFSLIPGIVDTLREEAQAENENFINIRYDNIKKIIKEQVKEQVKAQVSKILPKIEKTINEQLEAEVLTRSSNESKTSHVVATNLSELELKKILIDKMERNKRIDDEDKDEEPSAGSNRGSKRRRAGKEPESTSAPKEKTSKTTGKSTEGSKSHNKSADESAQAKEPMHTAKDLEEPTSGNKTLPDAHGPVQPWLSSLAQMEDLRESFNELMDTPLDFSAFVMNRLKVDTLTPKLLAGPTFELIKGSCKSLLELEYFLKEVYKATTDQLDWINPEGQQYPHDLRNPLPLIPNSRGRQVIPFDHFINNDLEYLSGCVSSQKYTTSVMKTKAADYGHIK